MHVVLFVDVVAKGVVLGDSSTRLTVLSLSVVFVSIPLVRLHTDVLSKELFGSEIVHEVLACDETTLFVSVFEQDLVESLDHGLHDLLEAEVHRLLLLVVRTDILSELLINLFDDPGEPVTHVGVGQFNLLAYLDRFLVKLLRSLDPDVELVDLGVGETTLLDFDTDLLVSVVHLQLMKLLCDRLVLMTKTVEFFFVIADGLKQLRVGSLSCEELGDDLLDVREASLSSDLLEGLLDLRGPRHLFIHLGLQKGTPELLGKEILVHLKLV